MKMPRYPIKDGGALCFCVTCCLALLEGFVIRWYWSQICFELGTLIKHRIFNVGTQGCVIQSQTLNLENPTVIKPGETLDREQVFEHAPKLHDAVISIGAAGAPRETTSIHMLYMLGMLGIEGVAPVVELTYSKQQFKSSRVQKFKSFRRSAGVRLRHVPDKLGDLVQKLVRELHAG
jgi:hypothetical protein